MTNPYTCPTCGGEIANEIDRLPRRQKEIYGYVLTYTQSFGASPTWQEIAKALGFKTRDQAYNCAKPLFNKGILGKCNNAQRSIIVLIQPKETK